MIFLTFLEGKVGHLFLEGKVGQPGQNLLQVTSWLRCLGATEFDNPAGSFLQSDRRTNVNTRMLVIDKPTHDKGNL
ncbi:hypothetical protein SD81_040935 [Tolypothrix campylonemoides VB511288]|nr:hypothetical protein SD81_040935 [Tolypothrix campylonemoides VB511288]